MNVTKKPAPYAHLGAFLMVLGGVGEIFLWALNADDPVPEPWFSILRTTAVVTFMVGFILKLVVSIAIWIVGQMAMPMGHMAVQVQQNGLALSRLATAPTVNLAELAELKRIIRAQGTELEERVLLGQAMVGRRFVDILKDSIQTESHASTVSGVEQVTKAIEGLRDEIAEVRRHQDAAARDATVVDMEDVRMLKRLDEKVRRAEQRPEQ